jgi:transcriptional regulator GlxA family with amidase domain
MSGSPAHEIGIVDYPGAQAACILGPTDLFGIASTIALDQRQSPQTALRVTHWKAVDNFDTNLSCVYDSAPHSRPQPQTLIIPPTVVDLDPEVPAGVVSWVRNRHAAGATLVSLCSGTFILAETGLVDGQSVATHQICAEALARRFPKIVVDTTRRIIDHGSIITAGGFLSWVDLSLFLVERILGPVIRAETARLALDDPEAGEARYLTGFAPPQTHGDRAVLKAQEWVHMRDGRGVSLAALAMAAGLERRTLLRRFASATGMTPIEYSRRVRIARALGGKRTLAERDRPISRLWRRGLICTCISQSDRRGAGSLPQKVWPRRHLASRFRRDRWPTPEEAPVRGRPLYGLNEASSADVALDLGAERRDVTADIGVVGGLPGGDADPNIPPRDEQRDYGSGEQKDCDCDGVPPRSRRIHRRQPAEPPGKGTAGSAVGLKV